MKRIPISFLLIMMTIALTGGQTVCAEPVAPLLKMTTDNPEVVKTLKNLVIPTKANVSLPVYPGTYFASSTINVQPKGSAKNLSAVSLVSTDPPEKIEAWYRKNLDGWSYHFMLFHEGQEQPDMDGLMDMQTIAVMAEDGDDPGLDLFYFATQGIRSRIIIRYEPKK